ncbi:MAG: cytochrome c [Verrucomicrobiota bacterium]|nr:cytochrome c [Verrucomicrobiota bacterium]
MRYLVLGIAAAVLMVIGLFGFRGELSRKPPLEVFPDMDRQYKLRPLEPSAFFKNRNTSQPRVPGTIARTRPLRVTGEGGESQEVYSFDTHPVNSGLTGVLVTNAVAQPVMNLAGRMVKTDKDVLGTNNVAEVKAGVNGVVVSTKDGKVIVNPFVNDMPLHLGDMAGTRAFVERGRERYNISCLPCHGRLGDGKGVISSFELTPANITTADFAFLPDGARYYVISAGFRTMKGYKANIDIRDRWAIVAYVRALQERARAKPEKK